LLTYRSVAIGGEGLGGGRSRGLLPLGFNSSAPRGDGFMRRSTGMCDNKFVASIAHLLRVNVPAVDEVRECVPILIIASASVGGPDDNFSEGNNSEVGAAWVSPRAAVSGEPTGQQAGRHRRARKRPPRHLRRAVCRRQHRHRGRGDHSDTSTCTGVHDP
jgi:hypothetical protein